MAEAVEQAVDLDRLSNYFVGYLLEEYQGTRHVRRVAAWLGFILAGIARVSDGFERSRTRQLVFSYRGRRYKIRYNHEAGTRGGIEVVPVLPLQGSPVGDAIITVTSLADAERFYHNLQDELDARF